MASNKATKNQLETAAIVARSPAKPLVAPTSMMGLILAPKGEATFSHRPDHPLY